MAYLLLAFLTVAIVELFVRLELLLHLQAPLTQARRSAALIQNSKVSDHWKEKALPAYSAKMFLSTARLAILLAAVFSPIVIALLAANFKNVPLWPLLVSFKGIALSVVIAFGYSMVRRQFAR